MIRRSMVAVLLAIALLATACAQGGSTEARQTSAIALTPTSVALGAESASESSDSTSEGIRVRGQWMIEVRNSDGERVSRVEFENALLNDGEAMLNTLLRGAIPTGVWSIGLADGPSEALVPAEVVGVSPFGPLTLEASWVAPGNTTITRVNTHTAHCIVSRTFTIQDCLSNVGGALRPTAFTGTSIAPISVGANQSVYVEVTLSFS